MPNQAQAQRWNGPSSHHWIEHRERHVAEHQNLTPHLFRDAAIVPGERVLDVGCGCGDATILAARAARQEDSEPSLGAAVGLDLSAPMLAVAQHLAARAGMVNARFVRGDAQACPLRRSAFDVVISKFGVMFFDDPAAAFARLADALRPGGRLAFLSWQDDTENEVFAIPLRAFGAYTPRPGPSASALFADPARMTSLLSRTGWEDIHVSPVSESAWLGTDVDDVLRYTRGMPTVRTMTASLNDPELADRALAAIAEQYAAHEHADGIWVRAAAWLVTASRAALPAV